MGVQIVKDGVYKMAWTAPTTWSTKQIVMASGRGSLNEQLRDNMLALDQHAHTGAAGDGSSTLTGVSFSNLAGYQFADQSADPTVTGTIQRNSANILYYDGSTAIDLTASDQAAGTPSLRTLSNTSTSAAAGNHQHSLLDTGTTYESRLNGNTSSAWNHSDTGEYSCISGNYQATGTHKILGFSYWFFFSNQYATGTYGEYYAGTATSRMKYNGVTLRTDSGLPTNVYNTSNSWGQPYVLSTWVLANGNVNTSFDFTVDKTDTGDGSGTQRLIFARGKLTIMEIPVVMGTI